jgi:hypothetical protein
MSYALGIDIGTTTIAAVIGQQGRVEPFILGRHAHTMPASVMPRGYEPPLVGDAADEHLPIESPQLIRYHGPEPDLGAPARMLGAPDYDAVEALGAVIDAVVDRVATAQGYLPSNVALTHPLPHSTYRPRLLDDVVAARRTTGIFVPEPIAAAAKLNLDTDMPPGALIVVCDMGGASFSATLVRLSGDAIEVLGEPGVIADFGGVDVDAALAAHVDALLHGTVSAIDRHDPAGQAAHRQLWLACRAAKHELSVSDEAWVDVELPRVSERVPVSRMQLDGLIGGRVAEAAEVMAATVVNAGVRLGEVQLALLVGGASRMAIVGDLINRRTGMPTIAEPLPDLTVAAGAAALTDTDPVPLAAPWWAPDRAADEQQGYDLTRHDHPGGENDVDGAPAEPFAPAGEEEMPERFDDRWMLAGLIAAALAVLIAGGVLLGSSQGRTAAVDVGTPRGESSTTAPSATTGTTEDPTTTSSSTSSTASTETPTTTTRPPTTAATPVTTQAPAPVPSVTAPPTTRPPRTSTTTTKATTTTTHPTTTTTTTTTTTKPGRPGGPPGQPGSGDR